MILSRKQIQQVIPLLFLWNICHVHAFSIKPTGRSTTFRKASTDSDNGEWSITDDWSSLSSDTVENRNIDSSKLFNQDFALYAASEMEKRQTPIPPSGEDVWISDVIDEIHNSFSTLPLYDTGFDEQKVDNTTASSMDQEIAMLVRCNEYPEGLLIYEGRALPPLTERERNDPFQLVSLRDESTSFQMTEFLKHSVAMMFQKHALPDPRDGIPSLDRKGVARWMTTCLKTEEKKPTSAHEKRVLQTISNFGRYGSGRLIQADLEDLYLSTIVGDPQKVDTGRVSPMRHLELRKPFLDAVWRDIRNHGILSPVEAERQKLINEIQPSETTNDHHQVSSTTLMDECEIVDWDFSEQRLSEEKHSDKRQARGSKSSHKGVELASDRKTPLFMRDGKFGKCFNLPLRESLKQRLRLTTMFCFFLQSSLMKNRVLGVCVSLQRRITIIYNFQYPFLTI